MTKKYSSFKTHQLITENWRRYLNEEVSEERDQDLAATDKHQSVSPFPPSGDTGSEAEQNYFTWSLLSPEEKRWVIKHGGTPEALDAMQKKQAKERAAASAAAIDRRAKGIAPDLDNLFIDRE
jgi:hypothetical protein